MNFSRFISAFVSHICLVVYPCELNLGQNLHILIQNVMIPRLSTIRSKESRWHYILIVTSLSGTMCGLGKYYNGLYSNKNVDTMLNMLCINCEGNDQLNRTSKHVWFKSRIYVVQRRWIDLQMTSKIDQTVKIVNAILFSLC